MTTSHTDKPVQAKDTRLDLIRVIACAAVVLLHVSARPFYMGDQISEKWWFLGNVISSLTHWCVPVFVMLSGALLLGSPKTQYPDILRRRVPRLLAVLIAATILYGIWTKVALGSFTWPAFWTSILDGQPYYHLYFFYLIIGLYLIAPLLSRAVEILPEATIKMAVIVTTLVTLVSFCWSVFSGRYTPNGSTFSWPYISYFLMGFYLYRYRPNLPYGAITVVAYLATVIGTQIMHYVPGPWGLFFFLYFSPTVYAFSLGIFGWLLLRSKSEPRRFVSFLAPMTLLVYVIHPIFMETLRRLYPIYTPGLMRLKYDLPLTFVATLILSFAVAYLLRLIPVVRKFC
ncbi:MULTISPECIES: acyltransferase [Achromobacter]|uniref:Acyltransferase family protein n=1 Tax=Achromobacter spanius TaxID=217203 RepID=A0ABY8GNJ1_9BURK|nr:MULTISPECIES: acyltransferase family protein [Achromobacter]WAI84350.1 acyltransferase family protein [Achromobacter spanius]WEX94433.1 acyltransferase family protein [Achromobacter sp. SS2-2022]WFP06403.1 acyltransferase family protein [Achromobacter spanius]